MPQLYVRIDLSSIPATSLQCAVSTFAYIVNLPLQLFDFLCIELMCTVLTAVVETSRLVHSPISEPALAEEANDSSLLNTCKCVCVGGEGSE